MQIIAESRFFRAGDVFIQKFQILGNLYQIFLIQFKFESVNNIIQIWIIIRILFNIK